MTSAAALRSRAPKHRKPAFYRRGRPRSPRTIRKWPLILATVVATLFVSIVIRNLWGHEQRLRQGLAHLYSVHDSGFVRAMGIALGPSVVRGNRVETLLNGDEVFPSMLAAIRGAQKTITFETYVYWSGDVGREFAEALSERARAGVKVHVLVDWVGSSRMDDTHVKMMRDAGVEFHKFRPLRWYTLDRFNNRTHRKLMVVDGRVGFTGGVGVASMWTGHAQDPDHWRDTHFRIEGPAVGQMQAAFLDNWIKTTGVVLHGKDYFPELDSIGPQPAQLFISSPSGGGESMELMYLLAIAAAEHSIRIESAYFIPDPLTQQALIDARKRGVRVQIILPGSEMDAETVRHASRARWEPLLTAGAEISEYQPTMYHCKVMIIDDLFVSLGSTNFDPRSFRLNDEANLNVYDENFARRQVEIFDEDLRHARRVTLEQWRHRPLHERILERVTGLISPIL